MPESPTWLDLWRVIPEDVPFELGLVSASLNRELTKLHETILAVEAARPVNVEQVLNGLYRILSGLERAVERIDEQAQGMNFDDFLFAQSFVKSIGPRLCKVEQKKAA